MLSKKLSFHNAKKFVYLSFLDSYNGQDLNDINAGQASTDDLFSRKSDEYNFFRNDNLDPTKQRLSHIAMLLEKLVSIT